MLDVDQRRRAATAEQTDCLQQAQLMERIMQSSVNQKDAFFFFGGCFLSIIRMWTYKNTAGYRWVPQYIQGNIQTLWEVAWAWRTPSTENLWIYNDLKLLWIHTDDILIWRHPRAAGCSCFSYNLQCFSCENSWQMFVCVCVLFRTEAWKMKCAERLISPQSNTRDGQRWWGPIRFTHWVHIM